MEQVPNGINSLLFPVYPDLAYDSWVTIGLTGTPDALAGEANVSTVQSTANPWFTNFDPGGGLAGENIVIDDIIGGAWYALNGDANGIAGTDLKVLVGQFTTTGDLSGQLYTQVFPSGDGSIDFRRLMSSVVLTSMDVRMKQRNYDANATVDDGTCEYPTDPILDCDGNCINDADGDGTCDENETIGCMDVAACNYNANATDDDGTCEYTSCVGCTDDTAATTMRRPP